MDETKTARAAADAATGMVVIHVTRRVYRGQVYGHEAKHCDESGCAGHEKFWGIHDGDSDEPIQRGDTVTIFVEAS